MMEIHVGGRNLDERDLPFIEESKKIETRIQGVLKVRFEYWTQTHWARAFVDVSLSRPEWKNERRVSDYFIDLENPDQTDTGGEFFLHLTKYDDPESLSHQAILDKVVADIAWMIDPSIRGIEISRWREYFKKTFGGDWFLTRLG